MNSYEEEEKEEMDRLADEVGLGGSVLGGWGFSWPLIRSLAGTKWGLCCPCCKAVSLEDPCHQCSGVDCLPALEGSGVVSSAVMERQSEFSAALVRVY
jgi:hypothetical protein